MADDAPESLFAKYARLVALKHASEESQRTRLELLAEAGMRSDWAKSLTCEATSRLLDSIKAGVSYEKRDKVLASLEKLDLALKQLQTDVEELSESEPEKPG